MANDPLISKSLIVVEDDPDDQFFLMSAFEKIGFAEYVMWLDSSAQLFDYLQNLDDTTGFPYTILLDYNMPVMNGEDILVELKKHPNYRQIPVLIYSTGISKSLIHKLIAMGADGCYVKSIQQAGYLIRRISETKNRYRCIQVIDIAINL